MKSTIPYIEKKFDEFNQTIFRGRLPKLPIVLSDAATFLGKCECRRMTLPNGQIQYYDFLMRINTRFDLPEREIEDTIIHEMIHYFIFYHGLHDTSSHGEIFKAIMNSINTTHGRHITIRHSGDSSTAEQATSTRRTWHV